MTIMNANPVVKIYNTVHFAFNKNLEGIDHSESLKVPAEGVNSINWLTGHIVGTRDAVLEFLGAERLCSDEFYEIYKQGTVNFDAEKGRDLEELKEMYKKGQEEILKGLENASDENIENAGFYGFHEAYHVGQLGVVRKLLGKEGQLR